MLADPQALRYVVDAMFVHYFGKRIDRWSAPKRAGSSSPGGRLPPRCGFRGVRKPNKLPFKTRSVSYALEYGQDTLAMHEDAVKPGEHVLLVDDLLATAEPWPPARSSARSSAPRLSGGVRDRVELPAGASACQNTTCSASCSTIRVSATGQKRNHESHESSRMNTARPGCFRDDSCDSWLTRCLRAAPRRRALSTQHSALRCLPIDCPSTSSKMLSPIRGR